MNKTNNTKNLSGGFHANRAAELLEYSIAERCQWKLPKGMYAFLKISFAQN